MKRKEKTELLRNLLKTKLNSKRGVHSAAEDEFERPNNLTTVIGWELVVIKAAHRKQRKRSMGELLFCMLRASGNR